MPRAEVCRVTFLTLPACIAGTLTSPPRCRTSTGLSVLLGPLIPAPGCSEEAWNQGQQFLLKYLTPLLYIAPHKFYAYHRQNERWRSGT